MKQFTIILAGVFMFLLSGKVSEVSAQTLKPSKIIKPVYFDKSKPLRDVEIIEPRIRDKSWKLKKIIPNQLDLDMENGPEWIGPDPVLQDNTNTSRTAAPEVGENFSGIGNLFGGAPPDTQGDVGPNHYFQMINLSFGIWDKEGEMLYGPADNNTLWDGFTGPWTGQNDGDPIVLYDEYSDRWIATQFALVSNSAGPYYEMIAVSATSDPLGEWYRYAYEFDNMPDYPKFGVWPDAYLFTINEFANGQSGVGAGVCAVDRAAMLEGDPDAGIIYFDLAQNFMSLLPSDADGEMMPPEGSPSYMVSLGNNSLQLWSLDIDWDNPDNSDLEYGQILPVESYSTNNINVRQPGTGTSLSTLSDRLMYRLQYRNFGDYEVMLTNHTVNANGDGQAGVRWYELRKDAESDGKWYVYQQGTFAPDDGEGRWMGSIAMNKYGDIGLGYSVSSTDTYPSIRFTGQMSHQPEGLGVMDVPETSILIGANSQTGINRWGDYAMMSIDPADGETFWFTTEYSKGGWNFATQIASFGYAQAPVADFTSDEIIIPVGETINFQDLTYGYPDSWEWNFEGGTPATSDLKNPENILYDTEGSFEVKMIAENELGMDTIIKDSYITASTTILPAVDFAVNKDFVCLGEIVSFNDMTEYAPIQWEWEIQPSTFVFIDGTDQNSENPKVIFEEAATYSVKLTAWNLNGSSYTEKPNLIVAGGYSPYFFEGFEGGNLKAQNWTVENPDNSFGWEILETGGTMPGNQSAGIIFNTEQVIGERDRLISPALNLIDMSSAVLQFEHAYAQFAPGFSDSLIIYVSTDCGENWTRIYTGGEDGNGSFATHQSTNDFWPETESDWCLSGWGSACITVDLTPWVGESGVRIAFETYSNYGNPLFIDNVIVSQFVGQDELIGDDNELLIYPNPTNSTFKVVLPDNQVYTNLQLVNHLGQLIYSVEIPTSVSTMEIKPEANWDTGIYFLKVNGSKTITRKVILY